MRQQKKQEITLQKKHSAKTKSLLSGVRHLPHSRLKGARSSIEALLKRANQERNFSQSIRL